MSSRSVLNIFRQHQCFLYYAKRFSYFICLSISH